MPIALMAMALAMQQPGPGVTEIAYVPIGGPYAEMMRQIEEALPAMAPPGVRLRRARVDSAAMEACIDDRTLGDRVDMCIRRLVPAPEGGAPVVALLIDEDRISNVTGSRVHFRHKLHCVGQRSMGFAALGDRDVRSDFTIDTEAKEEVRSCLATAMTPRNAALLGRDARDGTPLWRLPLSRYRAGDANHARGLGSEEAIVTIEEIRRSPARRDGLCLIRGRITQEDAYYFLRTGDVVEARMRCTGEARAGFLRAIAPAGLRRGSSARIHVDSDGELLFVEPL